MLLFCCLLFRLLISLADFVWCFVFGVLFLVFCSCLGLPNLLTHNKSCHSYCTTFQPHPSRARLNLRDTILPIPMYHADLAYAPPSLLRCFAACTCELARLCSFSPQMRPLTRCGSTLLAPRKAMASAIIAGIRVCVITRATREPASRLPMVRALSAKLCAQ